MADGRSDARTRLQQAAVELFRQQGFERTTAAEIAARAGVTERTFFRHFPDKREVLFDGQSVLLDALAASIAEAPTGLGALPTLFRAFRAVCALLEDNRPFSAPRQQVIAATPALQERELAKIAALSDALGERLRARGIPDDQAALAAAIGVTVFAREVTAWIEAPEPDLGIRLDAAERTLKTVLRAFD